MQHSFLVLGDDVAVVEACEQVASDDGGVVADFGEALGEFATEVDARDRSEGQAALNRHQEIGRASCRERVWNWEDAEAMHIATAEVGPGDCEKPTASSVFVGRATS